ncbi:hypothetical protein EIP91_005148 [Steccherinum ochraceum]|uniref:Uncharacterized protein n=1 Tax=Steccherinum ochraceum TaxID=92696 RepID=A0A4R0R7K0_9APHY|nr:hypothetical protein EIP91_005148 [Steccherinum ochraceum]
MATPIMTTSSNEVYAAPVSQTISLSEPTTAFAAKVFPPMQELEEKMNGQIYSFAYDYDRGAGTSTSQISDQLKSASEDRGVDIAEVLGIVIELYHWGRSLPGNSAFSTIEALADAAYLAKNTMLQDQVFEPSGLAHTAAVEHDPLPMTSIMDWDECWASAHYPVEYTAV